MRTLAVAFALVAVACGGSLLPEPVNGRCRMQTDRAVTWATDVGGKLFAAGWKGGEAGAHVSHYAAIETRFDTLQRDYAQMVFQLCEDSATGAVSQAYYERRRECLDRAKLALRALESLAATEDPDARAWAADGKLAWLQRELECREEEPAPPPADSVRLSAFLVCQRKTADGTFEDVERCDGATLKTGDRMRFGFQTDRAARIYILNYNSTGQFKMLFPPPGGNNVTRPGQAQFLPPAPGWARLDDVTGVTEVVQFVASIAPLPELERLRGVNLPPAASGRPPQLALQTRGMLEPFTTRGIDLPPARTAPPTPAANASAIPVVVERPGVAAVELRVVHE